MIADVLIILVDSVGSFTVICCIAAVVEAWFFVLYGNESLVVHLGKCHWEDSRSEAQWHSGWNQWKFCKNVIWVVEGTDCSVVILLQRCILWQSWYGGCRRNLERQTGQHRLWQESKVSVQTMRRPLD